MVSDIPVPSSSNNNNNYIEYSIENQFKSPPIVIKSNSRRKESVERVNVENLVTFAIENGKQNSQTQGEESMKTEL